LFPTTFWFVAAYVVFFLARRSHGIRRTLGRALGIWLIGLALVVLAFGATVQFFGNCPLERPLKQILRPRKPDTVYSAPETAKPRRPH
jgi:hypothetical protein